MIPHETGVRRLPGSKTRACSFRPTATHSSLHPELVAVEVLEDRVLTSSPWCVAELDIELHSFRFELPVRLILVVALEENSGLTTGSIILPILIFPAEVDDHVRARKLRGNPVTLDCHFGPNFWRYHSAALFASVTKTATDPTSVSMEIAMSSTGK